MSDVTSLSSNYTAAALTWFAKMNDLVRNRSPKNQCGPSHILLSLGYFDLKLKVESDKYLAAIFDDSSRESGMDHSASLCEF